MTSKKLFLFDIDGTLISPGGVSRGLLAKAISHETGQNVELGYNDVAGFTDRSITRHALARLDHGGLVSETLLNSMKIEFTESDEPFIYKDCVALLDAVEGAGHATCLLTENMKSVSKIKLEKFGLCDRFRFGIFADDAEEKAQIQAKAGLLKGVQILET